MNSSYFVNITRFLLLILAQVLVFNRLNFFGFINPMIYILFLYWFPVKDNRASFIGFSFLLGYFIDIFSDIHYKNIWTWCPHASWPGHWAIWQLEVRLCQFAVGLREGDPVLERKVLALGGVGGEAGRAQAGAIDLKGGRMRVQHLPHLTAGFSL